MNTTIEGMQDDDGAIIPPEQFAKEVLAMMRKHGIEKLLAEATPEEREEISDELAAIFGFYSPMRPR